MRPGAWRIARMQTRIRKAAPRWERRASRVFLGLLALAGCSKGGADGVR